MSYNQVPPPYPEAPYANTQGPPQYPSGQPYMGQPYMGPPYGGGAPPYGGGAPIIIMQQPQQQQQQQVIVHQRGTNHCLCCLICFLTGGLSLPCWIWDCITN